MSGKVLEMGRKRKLLPELLRNCYPLKDDLSDPQNGLSQMASCISTERSTTLIILTYGDKWWLSVMTPRLLDMLVDGKR